MQIIKWTSLCLLKQTASILQIILICSLPLSLSIDQKIVTSNCWYIVPGCVIPLKVLMPTLRKQTHCPSATMLSVMPGRRCLSILSEKFICTFIKIHMPSYTCSGMRFWNQHRPWNMKLSFFLPHPKSYAYILFLVHLLQLGIQISCFQSSWC